MTAPPNPVELNMLRWFEGIESLSTMLVCEHRSNSACTFEFKLELFLRMEILEDVFSVVVYYCKH